MDEYRHTPRRQFLRSTSTGIMAALAGLRPVKAAGVPSPNLARGAPPPTEPLRYIDTVPVLAGDDAIPFRKHTLDLGVSESVTLVDMNGDGRPDIV